VGKDVLYTPEGIIANNVSVLKIGALSFFFLNL
jgi:hypothetical protein